ncbi:Protein of unknown function [Actinacidiphila yanglinensis]|uniref:DUF3000 domain-containing protein n=1 Tax=Actinacidiphila yanglinensis TaxID=310779 RepID=A0A1H5XAR0_9ACTN|nr:DUF3000 domain-containing protein [Actinacidiphila yanglinensis]SEG08829.1 Protein of unknown function [Actinacidiphila yanglinensis]
MAAVHGHSADEAPFSFRRAVDGLRTARVRTEVRIEEVPAPRRLASYAFALEATVVADGEELADGRLVLLHEPDGHDAWHGEFRLVTLARAELEPEMAGDPLLPEVSWSWLTGALAARSAGYHEPSGTVSRASSHYFGSLSDRRDDTQIEIRASWTPQDRPGADGPDAAAHLVAWCDLLCACAGLPPAEGPDPSGRPAGGVVPLPKRRT